MKGLQYLGRQVRQCLAEWLLDMAFRVAPGDTEDGQLVRVQIATCISALLARSDIPEKLRRP